MTDTSSAIQVSDTETEQPIGTLEHLDPAILEIGDNVRDDAALGKSFIASIAENGVLVPITAVRDRENGAVVRVRNGQRRTLAARQLGLATVPVYVLPAANADDETIERIVHQLVTNDQKHDLTDAQRARGIQQMIDAGMSVTKVAKKLAVAKDTVKAAATAARSAAAMHALGEGQLSLAEAAAITEFEDMAGAVDRLVLVAGTRRFEHTLAQLRKERVSAQAEAQAAQGYRERGFTVLAQHPEAWNPECIALRHLLIGDGQSVDEQAISDAAQWAVLLYEDTGWCDVGSGEIVDEDAVDWETEDQPDAQPAEGLRHANSVTEATVFVPEYFCLDYRAAGLAPDKYFARNAGMIDTATGETVDLDADAREAARQQAEAERTEAEKRERRKVLALNKLGDAALTVRREFLTRLLARKTPLKGAATFVADCLARDSYLLTHHNALATTAELLGAESAGAVSTLLTAPATGEGRAQVITLGLVLGALEARTPKDAWRTATPTWGHHVSSRDYLSWLAENTGYPLACIEEAITGAKTSDEVYDQHLAEAVNH
ncbi:ParB/RepB/Spo0J family partition protein [Mycobacterium intracellulare]|uniref:ParB/RepB/Spo0J family partition protein n=1 Tax=Mycobacterium intracellulare TaxID=1767 RepID=UPI0006CA9220|nr:ParB/RepB/Spo0J family partition protein [Mycobacterium intracellulare]KPN48320.1 nuclease [Mycobacterium intracellulare subsp. chimaera]